MCGDEGKKTSVKLDEIVIYWERMTFFHDPDGLPLELHE